MINLKIEGMSCNHCKATVEKALRSVPGVVRAEVSLEQGRATVEGEAPVERLLEAVREEGYEAEVRR
jgi:copper chaperone